MTAHPQIAYRQVIQWLTSPDLRYGLCKHQRDGLLTIARSAPDGTAIWLDQSCFVRWAYRFWAWPVADDPPRVVKRWNEAVDTTALYAALDDETQGPFLSWRQRQPSSGVTMEFLEALMTYQTQKGKRFILALWDKAPWHTSGRIWPWIRDYSRHTKHGE